MLQIYGMLSQFGLQLLLVLLKLLAREILGNDEQSTNSEDKALLNALNPARFQGVEADCFCDNNCRNITISITERARLIFLNI